MLELSKNYDRSGELYNSIRRPEIDLRSKHLSITSKNLHLYELFDKEDGYSFIESIFYLIEWCFEYNVYYEGQTLKQERGNSFTGCANSCQNEVKDCTAFIFEEQYNPGNSPILSNCTLMTKVTSSIGRKIESNKFDFLLGGKKCKHYEPFKRNFDVGMLLNIQ